MKPVFRSEISVSFDDPDDINDNQNVDWNGNYDRHSQDPDAFTSVHPTTKIFIKNTFLLVRVRPYIEL